MENRVKPGKRVKPGTSVFSFYYLWLTPVISCKLMLSLFWDKPYARGHDISFLKKVQNFLAKKDQYKRVTIESFFLHEASSANTTLHSIHIKECRDIEPQCLLFFSYWSKTGYLHISYNKKTKICYPVFISLQKAVENGDSKKKSQKKKFFEISKIKKLNKKVLQQCRAREYFCL